MTSRLFRIYVKSRIIRHFSVCHPVLLLPGSSGSTRSNSLMKLSEHTSRSYHVQSNLAAIRNGIMHNEKSRSQTTNFPDTPVSNITSLDELVFQLTSDLRRLKRVRKADVERTVQILVNGTNIGEHGPSILSCCGEALADAKQEVKANLIETVWNNLKEDKIPSIEEYCALLSAHTENDCFNFEPSSVDEELKLHSYNLSLELYYLLFLAYCQKGNVTSAIQILHSMKEKRFPVDEHYFNALIIGKARSGDLKGAIEVTQLMKAARLEMSVHTHAALLQAHIHCGNIENLQTFYSPMAAEFSGHVQLLLKVLITAIKKDSECFNEVLSWFPSNLYKFSSDILNTVINLVHSGYIVHALAAVKIFSQSLVTKDCLYGSIVNEMVVANLNVEDIIDTCQLLKNNGCNVYSFNVAIHRSFKLKNFSMVTSLFEYMWKNGFELRPHYFLPIIIHEHETSGMQGLLQGLKMMKRMGIEQEWGLLLGWILPRMFDEESDPVEIGKLVTDATGMSYSSGIMSVIIVFLLKNRRLTDAAQFVATLDSKVLKADKIMHLLYSCISEYNGSKDLNHSIKLAVPIIKYVQTHVPSDEKTDHAGFFLLRCLESIGSTFPDSLDLIATTFAREDVFVSDDVLEVLIAKWGNSYNLKTRSDLIYHNNASQPTVFIHPRDMDARELESHSIELSSKGMNTRGTWRRLFLKYCQTGQLDQAVEIKQKFEQEHGEISHGMLSSLMGLYLQNQILEPAQEIFYKLKAQSSIEIDAYKIIDLATVMIRKGDVTGGIKLIEEECRNVTPPNNVKSYTRNAYRLLESLSRASMDIDLVKRITDCLIDNSLAEANAPVVGNLIKLCIDRGDVNRAVDEFAFYCQKYNIVPALRIVLYSVVDNPLQMDKVKTLCASVIGDIRTYHEIAFAKCESGDIDGAKAIFSKLGKRLMFAKVIGNAEYLAERQEYGKLTNLIKALSDASKTLDVSQLYLIGLKASHRLNDHQASASLIESMQQQDLFIPPQYTRK